MTPIQNAITVSITFLIMWWLFMSGGTTFSGDPIPPPLLIDFVQWLRKLKRDKRTEDA